MKALTGHCQIDFQEQPFIGDSRRQNMLWLLLVSLARGDRRDMPAKVVVTKPSYNYLFHDSNLF